MVNKEMNKAELMKEISRLTRDKLCNNAREITLTKVYPYILNEIELIAKKGKVMCTFSLHDYCNKNNLNDIYFEFDDEITKDLIKYLELDGFKVNHMGDENFAFPFKVGALMIEWC